MKRQIKPDDKETAKVGIKNHFLEVLSIRLK